MDFYDSKKIILYTTNSIYEVSKQTGGIKRFIELAEYINKKYPMSILYSRDDSNSVACHGFRNFIKLNDGNKLLEIFPPEVRYVLSNFSIIRKMRKSNYDKVIVFDVPTTIGLVLCGLNNVVLMIRKDMIGYEKVQNKKKNKWFKMGYQWISESICILNVKLIVTQCYYDINVLKERHPLLARHIERKAVVQINNVNPTWIVTKSEKKGGKIIKFDDTNKFIVCFIGGFGNPRKGQDLFLLAALEILNNRNDALFILVGGGPNLDDYKNKYKSDNIIFLGRQENPIDILKCCNLLVVPSFADSCPNTVMEALYNGIPVIGSRAGGIPEILKDEESLFDLRASSLAEKINSLMDKPEMLRSMTKRQSLRKTELSFNWAKRITELIC